MNNDGILHMDEKTPHIHATIVPIVTGERRKAKKEEQNGKKKYRKKSTQDVRLCADDVMARHKLKHYQQSFSYIKPDFFLLYMAYTSLLFN